MLDAYHVFFAVEKARFRTEMRQGLSSGLSSEIDARIEHGAANQPGARRPQSPAGVLLPPPRKPAVVTFRPLHRPRNAATPVLVARPCAARRPD
jgi:hypothetical protein